MPIKQHSAKFSHTLFEHQTDIVDKESGEVVSKKNLVIKKAPTQDEFLKLFAENIVFLGRELDGTELKIFVFLLTKIDYSNVVTINPAFKKYISRESKIHYTTIHEKLKSLENKEVILSMEGADPEVLRSYKIYEPKYSYIINPELIGKGSFRDIIKMRQSVITDFDFEKMEVSKRIIREHQYDGLEKVLQEKEKYVVSNVEQEVRDRAENTCITLRERDENNIIDATAEEEHLKALPYSEKDTEAVGQKQEVQEYHKSEQLRILELEKQNLKTKAKIVADELESKNRDLEIKKIELKQTLLAMGKVEEAMKVQ